MESYAYRPDGELTHASNSEVALVFERDALGRITKETQGTHWVTSVYDTLGLRTDMSSSLGAALSIVRNVMGDVTEARSGAGSRRSSSATSWAWSYRARYREA